MKPLILALACTLCLGASLPTHADDDATARFHAIYTKEWAWRQAQFKGADDEDNNGSKIGSIG